MWLAEQALEIEVVHDIPVKVMPANEAGYYMPPKVHSPQVRRRGKEEKQGTKGDEGGKGGTYTI